MTYMIYNITLVGY